ncbi:MAG: Sua5/YciO/YrdC/YwlC family protein [Gammaproteobacteria bacterium]|nr:Sua5/YciO/YrdC/YwlC family protein [Gammaproteobacteria bacterium]
MGRAPASRFRLRHAADVLRGGGIVAYPTEAVFGLGCDPLNERAVMRLLDIKRRAVDKGLILIASEWRQLRPFLEPVPDAIREQLDASWPGPVTWVLKAPPETPTWLRGQFPTLAVRVTAHPLAAALCAAFGGALVSTSANASGRPPARSALQTRLRCPGTDLVVPGATGGRRRPSEIRNPYTGARLRAG